MESYLFFEDNSDDILKSVTFASSKITHTSILSSVNLITGPQEIYQNLIENNLPLPVR